VGTQRAKVTNVAKHSEYFVEKRQEDGKWVVALPHPERVSAVRDTQRDAVARAKELAPEGVIHIKQANGKFRKG
jgi:predicted RNase H-like HicB family nuclease